MYLLIFYSSPKIFFWNWIHKQNQESENPKMKTIEEIIQQRPIISRLRPRNDDHISEVIPYKKRRVCFTDKTLSNQLDHFSSRLDRYKHHWPVDSDTENHAKCQLHTWATDSKLRTKKMVMLCLQCNVNLCRTCWRIFYECPDLVKEKPKIRAIIIEQKKVDSVSFWGTKLIHK